jgi:hypothetical protein
MEIPSVFIALYLGRTRQLPWWRRWLLRLGL